MMEHKDGKCMPLTEHLRNEVYYTCYKAAKRRHCPELMLWLNSLLKLSLWSSVLEKKFLNREIIDKLLKRWERMEII